MGASQQLLASYAAGGGTPFDPSQLTNPTWWHEGDLSVFQDTTGLIPCNFDGCNFKNWGDLSGAGSALIASGNNPIWKTGILNGNPIVRFSSATAETLGSTQSNNQKPFTAGFVVRFTNAANNCTLVDGATGGSGLAIDINANHFRLLKANAVLIGSNTSALSDNTWYAVFVTYDISGNWTFTINGVADGSGTNNQTFNDTQTQIATSNLGGALFDGDMAANIKWGNVNPTETTNMSNWWKSKYAFF